jgi:hypothetical protein
VVQNSSHDAGALFFDILRRLHRVIGSTFDTSLAPAEVCTQLKALLTKTEHSGSGRSSGDGGAEPMILLKLHDIAELRGSLCEELQQLFDTANAPNSGVIVVAQFFGTYVDYDDTDLELQLQHTITI